MHNEHPCGDGGAGCSVRTHDFVTASYDAFLELRPHVAVEVEASGQAQIVARGCNQAFF